MINIIFAVTTYLISSTAFAAGPISQGIYDEKTGNTLQAYCLDWQAGSESTQQICTKIQFFETTNKNTTAISEPIDNVAADQMSLPASAPLKSITDDDKIDPFAITKKSWDFNNAGAITPITAGSVLGAGLIAGSAVAMKIPGRPKVTESQDLSEKLPDVNALIYNVYIANEQVNTLEQSSSSPQTWTNFFNAAKSESPEQRVSTFVQLFNYASASDPNLINAIGPGQSALYTLMRIEYDPGYTTSQVQKVNNGPGNDIRLWYKHYYFVFVPNNEIPQYQQYIAATEASNARALKWWRQDMYIYFGAVVGTTLFVLAAPTIADLFRDLVVYPAHAARNSHLRRQNRQVMNKWPKIWEHLFDKNAKKTIPVSDHLYAALINAIKTKHPLH